MRKLTTTLTAANLVLGTMAIAADAQTLSPGAGSLYGQLQNVTPVARQAACRGWGRHCPPGFGWHCYYGHCRCVRVC